MTADLALIWPELILTIGGLVTLMLGTFLGDRQVGLYQLADRQDQFGPDEHEIGGHWTPPA